MHRNSQLIFDKYAKPFFKSGVCVLEIGPDQNPSTFQELIGGNVARWDTLDLDSVYAAKPTYRATKEYSYPVPSDQYDIVLSGQVIEHVRKIWRWFPELARMCKPGGFVITIGPVSWQYHEAPVDCWRIYPEGMRALADDAGLETITSTWECIELDRIHLLPQRLRARKDWLMLLYGPLFVLQRSLKLPLNGSFDTITIARKPLCG